MNHEIHENWCRTKYNDFPIKQWCLEYCRKTAYILQEVIQKMLKDPVIQECRYRPEISESEDNADKLIQESVAKPTSIQVKLEILASWLNIPIQEDCSCLLPEVVTNISCWFCPSVCNSVCACFNNYYWIFFIINKFRIIKVRNIKRKNMYLYNMNL